MASSESPHKDLQSRPDWDRLLVACQKNQVDVVQDLITNHGVDPCHANAISQSALHISAWWAHTDCMQILLQHGAQVHAANTMTGATPLHCAIQSTKAAQVKSQRLRAIDLLLRHGADREARDMTQRTPIDYLDEDDLDRKEILHLLLPRRPTLIEALNQRNNLSQLQQILQDKRVIQENYQGRTPLLYLVHEWGKNEEDGDDGDGNDHQRDGDDDYHVKALQLLLQHASATPETAVTIDQTDDEDNSCLDLLCHQILQLYKRSQSLDNSFALQTRRDAIRLVLSASPSTTTTTTTTKTLMSRPSSLACQSWLEIGRRNYLELAELWKEWKISPEGVFNRQGMSPLQFAARSGHLEMTKVLVQHPYASLKLWEWKDHTGKTALNAAQTNQRDEIVQLLSSLP